MQQAEKPNWISKDNRVLETVFACDFLCRYHLKCISGRFYDYDGPIPDEEYLKKKIYDELSEYLESGAARKTSDIMSVLRMEAYSEPLPLQTDRIHLSNGTYYLDGSFAGKKEFCNNRLPVAFAAEAPIPAHWLAFLEDLLVEEDILTLQEYMGYCLLPDTRAQKMLMLIGKGGEGKSRIGRVMREIFGDSMNTTSIQKIENNRFARADLEGKLVMIDDDMDMGALPKTNYIKSIVTSEGKMDLERKGIQSYQRQLYVRFICLGNGALTSLHDRSDGFFRRQIVLTTKDRPEDRVDDPFLADKLVEEKEGILLWMLEGLKRLISNQYHFTISQRAKDNITNVMREANNVLDFLKAEDYIRFDTNGSAATQELYAAYKDWCEDNAETPIAVKSFSAFLYQHAEKYHLVYSNTIQGAQGRRRRGYTGIYVLRRLGY